MAAIVLGGQMAAPTRGVPIRAQPQHSGDAGITTCSSGSTCEVTFTNVPIVRPWHPWDITGTGGVPDGLVRVDDILAVLNHYFVDKPFTPTPTPGP